MACEVCGKICLVKPSLVKRFRSCSRLCNAYLSQLNNPRGSELETTMIDLLQKNGLNPVHHFGVPPYFIDIAFPNEFLAVECDGDYWHSTKKQKGRDKRKDDFLQLKGWSTLRLTEAEINTDPSGCVERIIAQLTRVQSQPQ